MKTIALLTLMIILTSCAGNQRDVVKNNIGPSEVSSRFAKSATLDYGLKSKMEVDGEGLFDFLMLSIASIP